MRGTREDVSYPISEKVYVIVLSVLRKRSPAPKASEQNEKISFVTFLTQHCRNVDENSIWVDSESWFISITVNDESCNLRGAMDRNLRGAMVGSLNVGSLRVLLMLLTPLGLNPNNSRSLKPRLSRVEGRLLGGVCLPSSQGQE